MKSVYVRVPELPVTNENFTTTKKLSLIDQVKADLLDGAYSKLRPLLNATQNKDAINGSIVADRIIAALEYKKIAKAEGREWIANHTPVKLAHAMHLALRGIKDKNGNRLDHKSRRLLALIAPTQAQDNGSRVVDPTVKAAADRAEAASE